MKAKSFEPRRIALAVAASLLTPMAFASTIDYQVNGSNLEDVDDHVVAGLEAFTGGPATVVYPDANREPGSDRGFVVVDLEEDVETPGIAAYQKRFKSDQVQYDGCIMSAKGAAAAESCDLGPDSGKRFKLRITELNKPIDLAFDLTNTLDMNLYRVYGKFSNYTGKPATGFTVQVGTGLGKDFKELVGAELYTKPDRKGFTELAKFPGGLFGGSSVEGLPFLSNKSASFEPTAATLSSPHTRTTKAMPDVYQDVFPNQPWLSSVEHVPQAWTYDEDGKPWTDNAIVAYSPDQGITWHTYKKRWAGTEMHLTGQGGGGEVTIDLAEFVNDPTQDRFNDPSADDPEFADISALKDEINAEKGTDYRVQDIVHSLMSILRIDDPVVVDPAAKGWADKKPMVIDPANGDALVATWNSGDGVYEVEGAYQVDLGGSSVSMETMQDLVDDQKRFNVVPGYTLDVLEDLANVNVFYGVQVNENVNGPLTMRIWLTDDTPNVVVPVPPVTPPSGSGGGGGGCSIGGSGTPDPMLPGLVALGLGMLGWRRLRAARQG